MSRVARFADQRGESGRETGRGSPIVLLDNAFALGVAAVGAIPLAFMRGSAQRLLRSVSMNGGLGLAGFAIRVKGVLDMAASEWAAVAQGNRCDPDCGCRASLHLRNTIRETL